MSKKKILMVDDNPGIRQTLRVMLKQVDCILEEAENGKVALEKIAREQFDLILLDIQMPEMDGFETCRCLREELNDTTTYVIALTAKGDMNDRIKGLNLGFNLYLTKPFESSELLLYVRKGLEHTKKLRRSFIDPLTDLLNREAFNHVFEREIARSQRYNIPLSLVILDLDNFKPVNDDKGHAAGDAILVGLGELVQPKVRKSDLFSRWGGDEFGFILPNTASGDAKTMMDGICVAIREHDFPEVGAGVMTASIGVTELRTGDSQASFFKRADKALYQAKNAGRNCVAVL